MSAVGRKENEKGSSFMLNHHNHVIMLLIVEVKGEEKITRIFKKRNWL